MELIVEEQRMLSGEIGDGCQLAMEILVEVGEVYGAQRMVPMESTHIVLSAYKK